MFALPLSRSLSFSSVSSDSTTLASTQTSDSLPSASSIEAENEPPPSWPTCTTKRTRKRFSHDQLMTLEEAYYKASHPDRPMREVLADKIGVDLKSVTIWFQNKRQNKRQMEKRYALGNATNRGAPTPLVMYPVFFDGSSSMYSTSSSQSLSGMRYKTRVPQRTASGYLSLDHIASRTELPGSVPRTPKKITRHASYTGADAKADALWDVMPSSPPQPMPQEEKLPEGGSPSARDYLRFTSAHKSKGRTRSRRTLEWACAAARMAPDKTTPVSQRISTIDKTTAIKEEDSVSFFGSRSGEETEVETDGEAHEAITPDNSQILSVFSCSSASPKSTKSPSPPAACITKNMHNTNDTEIVDAALVLCGLRG